jgi:hypothetical protein
MATKKAKKTTVAKKKKKGSGKLEKKNWPQSPENSFIVKICKNSD